MKALTREEILNADDLSIETVDVPEWGGTVHVKIMTGTDRDKFEGEHLKHPTQDLRARLAVYTVCDQEGELLFAPEDIGIVGKKSSAALDKIFAAAIKLNAIGKEDIEELEKNS